MSQQQSTITLSSPDYGLRRERFVVSSLPCNYCGGLGHFFRESRDCRCHDDELRVCPICKGRGKVDAHVSIEWSPAPPHPVCIRRGGEE